MKMINPHSQNDKPFCARCAYRTLPGRTIIFDSGQTLFMEGQRLHSVFIVEDGWVKVTKVYESGDERVIGVLGPQDYIALLAVLQGKKEYIASAIALTKTTVQEILSSDVREAYESNAMFRDNCMNCAITRSNLFQFQVVQSGNLDIDDRIMETLRNLSVKFGRISRNSRILDLPFTKSVLADLIGIRRETLSRHLSDLQSKKLLTIQKNQYILHNVI